MRNYSIALVLLLSFTNVHAQKKNKTKPSPADALKSEAIADIQSGYNAYKNIALQIWDFAEVGYKEVKSSTLLKIRFATVALHWKKGSLVSPLHSLRPTVAAAR